MSKKIKNKYDDNLYQIAEVLPKLEEKEEKYDLDVQDLPHVPEGIIKYELGLMGFPIFSLNKKIKDNTSMKYIFSETNDEYLKILPTNDNEAISRKILQEYDEKIWYGLLRLYEENGGKKIITDYSRLLKVSGLKYENSILYRTKDSLERMRKCEIIFNGIYYDPVAKQIGADFLRKNKSINLISSLEIISFEKFENMKETDEKSELKKHFEKHGNIKEIAIIILSEDIIKNIELKAFKYFKHEDLLKIKSGTTRKLYVLLTKWQYWEKKSKFRRKTKFLASRIPLSWKKSNIPWTVKSILKACEELKKFKKIADYQLIKDNGLSESLIEFNFTKDILYQHNIQIGSDTTGEENLSIEKIIEKEVQSKNFEESQVVDVYNIPDEIIFLIKKEYQSDPEIQKNINEFVISQGEAYVKEKILYSNQNATKNYSGYLANALKGDWGQGYLKRYTEQKKKEEALEKTRAEEDSHTKIKKEYDDFCINKAIECLKNMSEEEKKSEIQLFENYLENKQDNYNLERFKKKNNSQKEIDFNFLIFLTEKYIKPEFSYDDWLIEN